MSGSCMHMQRKQKIEKVIIRKVVITRKSKTHIQQ